MACRNRLCEVTRFNISCNNNESTFSSIKKKKIPDIDSKILSVERGHISEKELHFKTLSHFQCPGSSVFTAPITLVEFFFFFLMRLEQPAEILLFFLQPLEPSAALGMGDHPIASEEKSATNLAAKLFLLDDLVSVENEVTETKKKRSFSGFGAPIDRISSSSVNAKGKQR